VSHRFVDTSRMNLQKSQEMRTTLLGDGEECSQPAHDSVSDPPIKFGDTGRRSELSGQLTLLKLKRSSACGEHCSVLVWF
jgi:hypothetical protein